MALFSWAYSITGQSARICPRIKSTQFSMLSGNEIFQSAGAQVWNNRIYWPGMKPAQRIARHADGSCKQTRGVWYLPWFIHRGSRPFWLPEACTTSFQYWILQLLDVV
ncbi:uncharacterized protein LOC123430162 [Hordeum vulgare subsp. vulgare]|uniref:uncharacterized protein LOC123430162 n=1 Tax=Hordeum vulgare subsp. vulgare TaxID=112509 RepID=UPI000B483D02|nr:uncharacterized protein LOC123430162 [Hordeum vulgare subsp. vulgare]